MIEQLFLQGGALGIVAYVVWFNTKVLKETLSNNTKALNRNSTIIQRYIKK